MIRRRDKNILIEWASKVPIAEIARKRRIHRRTVLKIVAKYRALAQKAA